MGKTPRIARDAGIVMALILVSRLLGFLRERAIADVFGLNIGTDLFRLAFNIPDLMYFLLIAGGLNAAFIPVFTGYLANDEEEDAWQLATTFFTVILAALVVMVFIGIVFTPQLTPLVAYGYRGDERAMLIYLMRLMFPAVFFTALAGAGMGVHKSYHNFGPPMWGPILYNAVIIASTYFFGRRLGIPAMAYGTVAGAIGNLAVQMPYVLKRSRGHPYRFNLRHPGLKRVLKLMGPAVISLSIFQINFIVLSNLASGLREGAPTALRIGQTIVQLPLGIFAMGVGMVILPALSRLMATDRLEALRDTFSKGLRAVFFVTIPSAAGLFVLRTPVIRLLFETGQFTAADTEMAAMALAFFSIGLWAQAGSQILTQVFYSLQDTKALVRVSALSVVVNTSLSFLLLRIPQLEHGALALAYAVTAIFNMTHYLVSLRKRLGHIDGHHISRTIVRSALASAFMGLTVWYIQGATAGFFPDTFIGRAGHVFTAVLCGIILYGGAAFFLRMEELTFVGSMIRERAHRRQSS